MKSTAYIYRVGKERETVEFDLPANPGYDALNAVIRPILREDRPDAELEHVNVLFDDRHCDMFVDDMGILNGQYRNDVATDIYRAASMRRDPQQDPENMPYIAGTAIVFTRRVWF